MRLTAKERILLHLLEFVKQADDPRVPLEVAREGIARASWIDDRHVPQNIRPLIREGLVLERTAHVKGGTRRRKVYFLTDSGRLEAIRLREIVRAETVQVRDASGVRESTVSQVLQEAAGRHSLLEIARQSTETGTVDLSTVALPGPAAEVLMPPASRLEGEYDWLGAAELYGRAVASASQDDALMLGQLYEHHGHALHRAALQASLAEEFRARMQEAIKTCEKAKEAYGRSSDPGTHARVLRCHATEAYMRFWIAAATDERRKLLGEAWDSAKGALQAFHDAGDALEYVWTYSRLSSVPILWFYMAWDARSQEPSLRDSIRFGEQAIAFLTTLGDSKQLAEAYVTTARDLDLVATFVAELNEKDELSRRVEEYWRRAMEISEEGAMLGLALCRSFWGDGTEEALTNVQKALDHGRKTRDRLTVGSLLRMLAYHKQWKSDATEDLDEWKELLGGALEAADNAKHEFACISFIDIRGGSFSVETAHAEYNYLLSRREANPRRRYELLKQGAEAAREGCKRAADHGYPDPLAIGLFVCVSALIDLGRIETNLEAKKTLLQDALERVDLLDGIEERRSPSLYFNRGETKIARAYAKSELACFIEDSEHRTERLLEAAQDEEAGLELLVRDMRFYERRGEVSGFSQIGVDQSKCADMYTRLYELSGDRAHLRKAAEMLGRAAESYGRPDLPSRIAECFWKAGEVHDFLDEHVKAAEEFSLASNTFKAASERVPQLKDFYQDLALYMQAWSEIERARHHQEREEYREAKDYYERAATLHGFSKKWGFMAPNYAAWAQVEHAEDLSRTEKAPEAIAAFGQATRLFREAKVSLEGALVKMQDPDERQMAEALIKAGERRLQYCAARIALEEARVLDKNDEHSSSSQKYGQAADGFENLAAGAESDRDRRDLSLIATLTKAWEAMAKAEADASPELYAEAARFFEAARELSPNEKAKALALGHSRFCNALEAGARFVDTRDPALHASAIKHLDSAASHYARAGVESASEYSRASRLLFDAYAAMDRAGQETDPEKKAKDYLAVEKILGASAVAYGQADHPGRRDQALRLLESVKHERELVMSLIEVFRAPLLVSSTAAFATPAPSYEHAVGIERLEHADIRARLIPGAKELAVGEDLDLKLELVNAGRAVGQLIKVEELVPQDFELVARPEKYEMEENALNLRGRRLEPLKTEQVRVVLKPMAKGVFSLRPRIMYLDESGNYKSHEPEPVDVNVSG